MRIGINDKKAFTLIELVVVIAIMAILAGVAIPSVSAVIDNSKESADNVNAEYIEDALKYANELNRISRYEQIETVGKAIEISGIDPDEALVPRRKGYGFYYESASDDVTVQNSHPGAGFVLLSKESPILFRDGVWQVVEYVHVQSVGISPGTLVLKAQEESTLAASIYPSNSTKRDLIWESDNESIATVDSNGKVTALSPGIANIKATVDGTEVYGVCVVLVFIPAQSISIPETLGLAKGVQSVLVPSISPGEATGYNISWSVDDSNIVKVIKNEDNSCKVSADSVGEALITVTLTNADGSRITDTCRVNVAIPATSVSIPDNIELIVGESKTLETEITPTDSSRYTLNWISDNTNIATVSDTGVLTALSSGETLVRVTLTNIDGSQCTHTCAVTVDIIPVSGVSLNYSSISLKKNNTISLVASVSPSNATDKGIIWSSSNNSVATVSETGLVQAKKNGTAVITAKSRSNPEKSATCTVKVTSDPVTSIKIGYWERYLLFLWRFNEVNNKNIALNNTFDFDIRWNNENDRDVDTDVIWESSNTSVITINQNGLATAVGRGSATITATHKDDCRVTATCTVQVP